MSATIIQAQGISKRYRLGGYYGYSTIRESVANAAAAAMRRSRAGAAQAERRWLWALKDVSFEIAQGETVGVIGVNGAGKSTILKILSRVTKPTEGWAEITGRVGSLLDVGTGFHPELTGRENVFLAGAILGMRKNEIRRRFDEIVSFADIEGFLDTPVKRYSSGMKVRLGFAIAAHLEPEILIVDEVLAVGDIAFQKKCLGKMGDVTAEGRTVLFVSHTMSLVRALCRRGLLLEHGSLIADGKIDDVAGVYLRMLEDVGGQDLRDRTDRRGWRQAIVTRIDVHGAHGGSGRLVTGDEARFVFQVSEMLSRTSCAFTVYNHLGQAVTTLSSAPETSEDQVDADLADAFECTIDELPLAPGRYRVDVKLYGKSHLQDHIEGAVFFDVEDGPLRGRPLPASAEGDLVVAHRWRVSGLSRSAIASS
jgi:lipopolysaccharide transport system ATP-binding protein